MSRRILRPLGFGASRGWAAAVTIPARDEEDRIVACLDAAATALAGSGGIVLYVNASRDGTASRAAEWFRSSGTAGLLVDDAAAPAGFTVGEARARALDLALGAVADDGILLTTDADSRVEPDWIAANRDELELADIVCGTVLPDPAEFAALPAIVSARGAPEGQYIELLLALERLIDPLAHDPAPAHRNEAGASLAFRPALYRDVGMPHLAEGEDRAFVARAGERGWRVRHSSRARVVTSCRLTGRTPGGMAAALRGRIAESDPWCDETLEPAATAVRRLQLRAEARSGSGARTRRGGAEPAPARQRLRLSDVERELPALRAALAQLTAR